MTTVARCVPRLTVVVVVALVLTTAGEVGCGGAPTTAAARFAHASGRTCVVLSVGGFKGVAHAGALHALRERGVHLDCAVGNSMGALVAALYATAPTEDPAERVRSYFAAYVHATEQQAAGNAAAGAILGAILTGGLGGALLGGVGGAATVDQIDHDRAVQVLRATVHDVNIEDAPLPFATFYDRRAGEGLETVDATRGDLADAVGRSIANPFIFSDIDLRRDSAVGIDPGADRVSATPVEDACRLFPDARLLAVNVTDRPAFYSATMHCPVLEVRVPVGEVADANGVARGGPAFDALVRTGDDATRRALSDAGM